MDSSLVTKILIGQVTDLVERQKTVTPDELAEEIVNCCCYFVLKKRRDSMAANSSVENLFGSIGDSLTFAGEVSNSFRDVALELFKKNYSFGEACVLHEEVCDRILEEDAWERVKKYFWDKHKDDIGDWWC